MVSVYLCPVEAVIVCTAQEQDMQMHPACVNPSSVFVTDLCFRYENLGNDGLHSMYRWFEDYQDQHFPDPMGLRDMAHKWSLGLYPGVIKAAMAVYDIPEAIAVARNTVCRAGSVAAGFAELSRVQLLAYYAGMLAYYWLLAIPAMGFVFGLYLYVCVCWFHVHYDEAFSALRIANFKGFSRLHITKDGDLEIFTLGIDRVPTCWREDDRWYSEQGAGSGRVAAHEAAYPSRWVPVVSSRGSKGVVGQQGVGSKVAGGSCAAVGQDEASMGFKVVDYLKVPRQRPGLGAVPV